MGKLTAYRLWQRSQMMGEYETALFKLHIINHAEYIFVWTDEYSGYLCGINKNFLTGNFNGLVGLPLGHPFYEANSFSEEFKNLEFNSANLVLSKKFIYDGDDRWWLGFQFELEQFQDYIHPACAFDRTTLFAGKLFDYAQEKEGKE
jgi:hypothetical protein